MQITDRALDKATPAECLQPAQISAALQSLPVPVSTAVEYYQTSSGLNLAPRLFTCCRTINQIRLRCSVCCGGAFVFPILNGRRSGSVRL